MRIRHLHSVSPSCEGSILLPEPSRSPSSKTAYLYLQIKRTEHVAAGYHDDIIWICLILHIDDGTLLWSYPGCVLYQTEGSWWLCQISSHMRIRCSTHHFGPCRCSAIQILPRFVWKCQVHHCRCQNPHKVCLEKKKTYCSDRYNTVAFLLSTKRSAVYSHPASKTAAPTLSTPHPHPRSATSLFSMPSNVLWIAYSIQPEM